ncbi:MAG: S8/S53 family peptidase [Armatimonadetes bacterium]|nr:S8/S53 family peptidase [Armatimonadota bacterium]MDW8154547.1 S8/S53 family peptidase [Armatimonadota bacterium]
MGSLDYEARGQADGVHGSPTPDQAIRMPDATEAEFRTQVAFERIGLLRMERAPHRPRGAGVTVVILDSAPDLQRGEPAFDAALVDVYVEWPHPLPENLPALRSVEEAEEEGCGLSERRRYRAFSPLVADADGMRQYRAHHGLMIAALVRRIAPEANIVLVRLLNGELGTLTGDLIEAMRWVRRLQRVPHPSGAHSLVYGSLVYNLSLGVDRSQPETVQSCVLLWAVDEAARAGAVLVCAAGNLSEGRPENCLEPAAYGHFGDTRSVRTQVIPVAASSYASPERYAWFSNEAHFAAPGEDLILDCGVEVAGSRYVRWSGTSFASALVTGIVALHLSAGLPPYEVKQRLWEEARHPHSWDGVHLVQAGG